MRIFGLTGGIASGKSSIAAMFRKRGIPVIDADKLARDVVMPGSPGLEQIVRAFGREYLLAESEPAGLDRKKLGALVFANPEARTTLNGIVHPLIRQASDAEFAKLRAEGAKLAIYEAALLVENKMQDRFDGLIVVKVDPTIQKQRLMARENVSAQDAEARLAAQLPLADKLAVATHVIDNGGTLAESEAQVIALLDQLHKE